MQNNNEPFHHHLHREPASGENTKKNQYFQDQQQHHQQQSHDPSVGEGCGDRGDHGDKFAPPDALEGDDGQDYESASTISNRSQQKQDNTVTFCNHRNLNDHSRLTDIRPASFYQQRQRQYEYRVDLVNQQQRCVNVFVSEFLGTLVFVYLSQAATSSFELIGTQNDTIARSMATIFARSLALLAATLLTLNISGAHLNPAYSLSAAIFCHIRYRSALRRVIAQYLGAFFGATLLHLTYFDKLGQRHSEGLLMGKNFTLRAHGNLLSTGKFFSSFPPTEVSHFQLFTSYILANASYALLAATILGAHPTQLASASRQNGRRATLESRDEGQLKPIHLAVSYGLVLAAFSANGGPVLNPAQDFSSRLYMALTSWGSSAFNLHHGHYWWFCGILAPHVGFTIGFGLFRIFCNLKRHREDADDYDNQAAIHNNQRDNLYRRGLPHLRNADAGAARTIARRRPYATSQQRSQHVNNDINLIEDSDDQRA